MRSEYASIARCPIHPLVPCAWNDGHGWLAASAASSRPPALVSCSPQPKDLRGPEERGPSKTPGVYRSGSCCIWPRPQNPTWSPRKEAPSQRQRQAPLRDALGQAPDPRRVDSLRSSPAKAPNPSLDAPGRRPWIITEDARGWTHQAADLLAGSSVNGFHLH